ncbi:MAG TPA: hypothetical protein VFA10_05605, partial [Ktedonobacteraceae bacterium]|nr:hypothetical protein [Ktedonobacteraceae bacterium]
MGARNRVISLNCFPIIGLLLLLTVVTAAATTIFHFSQAQQVVSQRSLLLNPIQQENQRPGTSAWEPTSPANLAPYDPKT